jgi:hypothetical protein
MLTNVAIFGLVLLYVVQVLHLILVLYLLVSVVTGAPIRKGDCNDDS